jgi:replication-associated recombination protein RarA
MKNEKPSADNYEPRAPRDLIGHARAVAEALLKDVTRRRGNLKLLFHGAPGNGKTSIANIIARAIAAHKIDIESLNGRNVTIELIRQWQLDVHYGSLFGGWKVKVINEVDLVAPVAQDLMLTYLDELPPQTAVIAASNQNVAALTERFQTRFRLIEVRSPRTCDVSRFLQRWRVPKRQADFIAGCAAGNVRAALLDASDFLTFGECNKPRPKTPVVLKDPVRQEASKRAWQTMRERGREEAVA